MTLCPRPICGPSPDQRNDSRDPSADRVRIRGTGQCRDGSNAADGTGGPEAQAGSTAIQSSHEAFVPVNSR